MKLKKAIEIFKKEKRSSDNAYDWYRRSAKENGKVYIGDLHLDAFKIGNTWHIDDEAFEKAIKDHRAKIKLVKQYSEDFYNGVYHGKVGEIIMMEGGGYRNYNNFIFAWDDFLRARKRSDGSWYCKQCSTIAKEEHNKLCSINSDYHFCSYECTLSKVYCQKCYTKIEF